MSKEINSKIINFWLLINKLLEQSSQLSNYVNSAVMLSKERRKTVDGCVTHTITLETGQSFSILLPRCLAQLVYPRLCILMPQLDVSKESELLFFRVLTPENDVKVLSIQWGDAVCGSQMFSSFYSPLTLALYILLVWPHFILLVHSDW